MIFSIPINLACSPFLHCHMIFQGIGSSCSANPKRKIEWYFPPPGIQLLVSRIAAQNMVSN